MRLLLFSILLFLLTACFPDKREIKLQQLRASVVDSLATDETLALFDNLVMLTSDEKVLIGQHNGLWNAPMGEYMSHFQKLTGKNPALLGKDYMDIIGGNSESENRKVADEVRSAMQLAYRRGNVNVMCWHYREPEQRGSFYTWDMTDEKKERLFKSILEGGSNHETYKSDLRRIAGFSKSLTDDNGRLIPYIFRPFHEFDGEWFWWGDPYSTPKEFIDVWRFTVHYLRDSLQVHNLLYAFSPDIRFDTKERFLNRYPGDDYVDIIGFDDYGDFKTDSIGLQNAKRRVAIVSELAREKGKAAALTEVGYFIRKDTVKANDERHITALANTLPELSGQLAFIMFWANGGGYDYCVPDSCEVGAEAFLKLGKSPDLIFEQDNNQWYTIK